VWPSSTRTASAPTAVPAASATPPTTSPSINELEADEVELQADSELIVRQLEGRYRVKHPDLKPLFAEAKRLIAPLRSFKIRHVRREENKDADRLVNEALDGAE
jgi:ribonuclease HI